MIGAKITQPPELRKLMEAGLWPTKHEEAIQQNLNRRIPTDRVHLLIPSEDEIFLYPDPTMTLASEHEASRSRNGETDFFAAYDNTLEQIDPERALFIADFGHGSDAPIAVDLRSGIDDPPVIGLKWHEAWHINDDNRWVKLAETFSAFVETLGLWHLEKFK